MSTKPSHHYATLGVEPGCADEEIRAAYRDLAKRYHPDLHPGAADALVRFQAINAAYDVLSQAEQRAAYDAEQGFLPRRTPVRTRITLKQDVLVGIDELLRGTRLTVRVHDPMQAGRAEVYELEVPSETAPGTRFRIQRETSVGGTVEVRVKARRDARFKVSGSDLKCDLRIRAQRAVHGGAEMVRGASGRMVAVSIPRNVAVHEVIRIPGEGLPRVRGGRGDLLVRIVYRPEVRVERAR